MSLKKREVAEVGGLESERPAGASASILTDPAVPPERWGMIYLLARIFYGMRQKSEDTLRPHNLTPMQFTILDSLKRWNGLSSAELSRRFRVTPQTMGEMVGNLERRSLVARVQDPANRRALRLSLTEAGSKLLDVCETEMQAVEAEMFEQMSARDLEAFRGRLAGLHDRLAQSFRA